MRRLIHTALLCALAALPLAQPAGASDLDERRVVPAGTLPAVGLLVGNGGRCTGFLTGSDRVIVTAAHCVFKRTDGTASQDVFEFQPGYRNGSSTGVFRAHVIANGDFHFPDAQLPVEQVASQDWAILLTDKPTGIAPLNLAADVTINQLADKPLSYVGYSVDVEDGRVPTEDASCRVIGTEALRIDHSCRGSPGSSGGPIFLLNPDGSRGPVVGVVSSASISSTSERLVITNIRLLAAMRTLPDIDFGGHAAFIGAFLNATKALSTTH